MGDEGTRKGGGERGGSEGREGGAGDLVDEDGRPAIIGEKPVNVNGRFEAGRPAGLRAGTELGVALAINLTALRLKPGIGYSFVFGIDSESRPEWRAQLFMRTPSQG